MTYFPHPHEQTFKCQGCGKWFMPGNISCCVAHAPGTCCQMGDTEVAGPDPTRYADHVKHGAGWKEPFKY